MPPKKFRTSRRRRISGGFDCEGEIDFLTQNEIPEMYVYKLGQNCFDIRSLVKHIIFETRNGKRATNPFTRQLIKADDLDNIKRRFKELNQLARRNREFFSRIYILLNSRGLLPYEYRSPQFNEIMTNFIEAGSTNPFVYFYEKLGEFTCEYIDDDNLRNECNNEIEKLRELYYET